MKGRIGTPTNLKGYRRKPRFCQQCGKEGDTALCASCQQLKDRAKRWK